MSNPVDKFYQSVIEDVVLSSRELFMEEGIDESVLAELKQTWRRKIRDSKVFEFSQLNRMNADVKGYGIISPLCSTNGPGLFVPSIHLAGPRVDGPRRSCATTATIALPYGLYNQQIRDLNNAGISLQHNGNGHFLAILPPEQLRPLSTPRTSDNLGKNHSVNDNNKPTSRCFPSNFNLPLIRQKGSSLSKFVPQTTKTPLTNSGVATISDSTMSTTVSSSLLNASDQVISPTTAIQTNVNTNQNDCDIANTNNNVDQSSGIGSLEDGVPNNQKPVQTSCSTSDNIDSNLAQREPKSIITTLTETNKLDTDFSTPPQASSSTQYCPRRNMEQRDFCGSSDPNQLSASSISHQDNFTGYSMGNLLPAFYQQSRTSVDNTPSTLEDFLDDISSPVSQNYQNYIPDEEHPKFPRPDNTTTTNNSNNNNIKPTLLDDSLRENDRCSLGQTPNISVESTSDNNSTKGSNSSKTCQLSAEDMKTIEEILQLDGTNDEETENPVAHEVGDERNLSSVKLKGKRWNLFSQCDGEDDGSSCSSDNTDASKGEDSSGESGNSSSMSDRIEEAVVDIGVESDPLNTADDDSDADICAMFESENIIVCQFVKVSRIKNKWKFQFKDGILNVLGRDMLFSKAVGDAEW